MHTLMLAKWMGRTLAILAMAGVAPWLIENFK